MPVRRDRSNVLIYILIALVVCVLCLTAYIFFHERSSSTDNTAQIAAKPDSVVVEDNSSRASDEEIARHKRSLKSDYERILRKNPNEVYLITDLNNNGFPELWITYRYGEHYDNLWHVYHSERGHAREIYSTADGPIARVGNSVMIESYDTYRLTYTGSAVREEAVVANMPDDQSIPATDFGPLHAAFR